MGRIDEKKQYKMERLLETAFSLFTSKGMAKTSVSDITTEAGVAKGTFYLYFRDKYDIGDKLIAHKSTSLFRHAMERLEQAEASCFEDKIIVIIDDLLDQLQANPLLLRFINKNLSWGIFRNALTQPGARVEIDYEEQFHQLIQADPDIEWIEPEIMLYTIIELVGSTCHSVILSHDPVDLQHYKPYLFQTIRSIVRIHQKPSA